MNWETITDQFLVEKIGKEPFDEEMQKYIDYSFLSQPGTEGISNKMLLSFMRYVADGKLEGDEAKNFISLIKNLLLIDSFLLSVGDKYRSNGLHQIRVCLLGFYFLKTLKMDEIINPLNSVQ